MKTGRVLSLLTMLITGGACASANLDIPENHPANPRAATRPLELAPSLPATAAAPGPDQGPAMPAEHHHYGSDPMPAPSPSATPAATDAAPSSSAKPQSGETWTCPMHSQIVRNEPGKCPICGMTLVKSSKSHQGAH